MSQVRIGIRHEDKSRFERRTPITPAVVADLSANANVCFNVQPSPTRVYADQDYVDAGARLEPDLSNNDIVFAVKEIPVDMIDAGRCYVFFSHTIKGQPYNMALLRRLLEQKVTLIDYECVADDKGRRLVFFGRYAGLAGMINTFQAYGERLRWEGKASLFSRVRHAYEYEFLSHAQRELRELGRSLADSASPQPIVVGFSGYGNVSQGAQEICDLFPCQELSPEELLDSQVRAELPTDRLHRVVFHERHMFERQDGRTFHLQQYFDNPSQHRARFEPYLPHLSILVNAILWTPDCPRLVTKEQLARLWPTGVLSKFKVIGDISIDIEGSIECSLKATHSDAPCYVYNPRTATIRDGVGGEGPVIMAVDNLPCELPKESSDEFSRALKPFLPALINADWSRPFAQLDLPGAIKRAVIIHQGELTPEYRYMQEFLD